jgi:hypothetical protein
MTRAILRSGLSMLAATVAALCCVPAWAADRVLAPVLNQTALSAWGGHVVFSARDSATGMWTLEQWTSAGVTPLAVAAQGVPFDVDAGPDQRGRPVAVYSHCRPPADNSLGPVPGCVIYLVRLDVAGAHGREVRVLSSRGASETTPTIWAGRIAFARTRPGQHRSSVWLQRAPGSRGLISVAGGDLSHCAAHMSACGEGPPTAWPTAMDLGPHGLVFVWQMHGGNVVGHQASEVRIDSLDGHSRGLASTGDIGECATGPPITSEIPSAPNALGGAALFLDTAADCAIKKTLFIMAPPAALAFHEYQPTGAFAYGLAHDASDGTLYWVRGPDPDPEGTPDICATAPGACTLVASTGLAFRSVHGRSRPMAPLF